jgi:CO/xanthine dehydrogenase Mo-binding subunit
MPGGAARITLSRDGAATVSVAAHEMGMGTATVQTQVEADRLGLSMDRVEFHYGDTNFPGVVLAGGSQQTASIGASVAAAHRVLVTELLKLAGNDSPLAGLGPNDVGGLDGGLGSLEDPERRESYASILERAQRAEVTVEADAYHVPVHLDVPEIEVMWSDEPDPRAPMGAKGIGEIGITGVGAAVANAVFNATGKRVRELPITLDKTL